MLAKDIISFLKQGARQVNNTCDGIKAGSEDKIVKIRKLIGNRKIILSVDGGINPMTAAEAIAAGADMLVAGTAVFAGNDFEKNIKALR